MLDRLISLSKRGFFLLALFPFFFSEQSLARSLPDFTKLIEDHGPGVVNISTIQRAKETNPYYGRRGDEVPDVFRYFFGENFNYPQQDKKSLGSGFIISKDGYILTNNHVVAGADEVIVRMQDRSELQAEIIGTDRKSDLALLKVDGKNLPVLNIGDSDNLRVGEWVLAIGSPFGFESSVTAGIVSHKGRSLPRENYVPFIQTDVAINPGNSGGPLFNLDGEVIGINSQIYSRTGGFMGLSFAIPINIAMDVANQLKASGKVSRGWLGVVIQEINRDLADSFGLKKPRGALVAQVQPDSPASEAGLQEGDVILEFAGKAVDVSSDLPILVGVAEIDSLVDVKVLRDKKTRIIKVRIGSLPEEGKLRISRDKVDKPITDRLGLVVGEIKAEQSKRWKVNYGLSVREVAAGPAKDAGIMPEDIITMVNNRDVDSIVAYNKVLESLPSDKWIPILVYRKGNPVFIPVYIPLDK